MNDVENKSEIVIYKSEDGKTEISVKLNQERYCQMLWTEAFLRYRFYCNLSSHLLFAVNETDAFNDQRQLLVAV